MHQLIEIVERDGQDTPDYEKRFEGTAEDLAVHVATQLPICDWSRYRVWELGQETDPEMVKVSREVVTNRFDLEDWMDEIGDELWSVTISIEDPATVVLSAVPKSKAPPMFYAGHRDKRTRLQITGIWAKR